MDKEICGYCTMEMSDPELHKRCHLISWEWLKVGKRRG